MSESQASTRYAKALLELASKQGQLDAVAGDLNALSKIAETQRDIFRYILNSAVSKQDKENFIRKLLSGSSSELLVSFLQVLIKKNRFKELLQINQIFQQLYEKSQGIEEVTAVTAFPLNESNEEKLKTVLAKKLGAKIRLKKEIDKKIMGGLIVRFGSKEIDGSYRHRLDRIRQTLMA